MSDEAEQIAKTITSSLHLYQIGVALNSALKTGYLLFRLFLLLKLMTVGGW